MAKNPNLERLKVSKTKGQSTPTTSPSPKNTQATNKVRNEVDSVTFRCGHGCSAGLFKGRDCPQCESKRNKDKQTKKAQQRERQGNRRSEALNDFRFPDGTNIQVNWNGSLWGGLLSAPHPDGVVYAEGSGPRILINTIDSGVESLLRKLKDLFLARTAPKPEEAADEPKT